MHFTLKLIYIWSVCITLYDIKVMDHKYKYFAENMQFKIILKTQNNTYVYIYILNQTWTTYRRRWTISHT